MFRINRTLNRNILRLAIPSILASITIPLVGIVDTAIVGHIGSEFIMGGVIIGSMLFDLLYWNFGFLRVGTGGMTAQAYGNNDRTKQANILLQGLTTAFGSAMVIWLVQNLFLDFICFTLQPLDPAVEDFARRYFFVRIWGAPATLMLFTLKGWFIGMQNTVYPMICDLVVNIVNIMVSYYLAVMTPIGAIGVAHGTVLAQYSGLLVAFLLLIRYRKVITAVNFKQAFHWYDFKQLFALNGNLFLRSLCFMVVYAGFTYFAKDYGTTELDVSGIMMKLFMLFSYFIDGFAYAGEALTGKFWGRKDRKSIVSVVRILFYWTTGVAIVCTLVYWLGGDWMVHIMTNELNIIAASEPYMIWLILMPILGCYAFMWDGIYIGAAAGKEVRNCMVAACVGFILVYFGMKPLWGIQALYAAYFAHLFIRAFYLTLCWKLTLNKL